MKKIICFILLGIILQGVAKSQNTLFDDTRLSSIYITIPPDSLKVIYDSVLSDHYYMARFIFDDNVKKDTLENVGFRLRGNTSRYSLKKSFKISFNEYVSGRKYQGVKKLNLNGQHNDPTMIREKLFYDLWKKSGMVQRRTCFVKVFINNAYYGLYTNLEEMDKQWLTLVYPDNSGNLYKCTYPADLDFISDNQEAYKNLQNSTVTGGRVYELETNTTADDYTRLAQLITKLNQQPNSQFVVNISQILNVDKYLKSLALDVATGNWDNYSYNKNNYYLYDNPKDAKFDYIAYDADNTFGVDWFGIDWGIRDCRHWINTNMDLPLAQKILSIPAFFNKYKISLDSIARFVINPDTVFSRIDGMKQMIQQAAEADMYRVLDNGYTISDFNDGFIKTVDDHTPYGIKPFLAARKKAILDQLNPSGIDEYTIGSSSLKVFPNPATENITVLYPLASNNPVLLKIIDVFGNIQKEIPISVNNGSWVVIPVQDLIPGVYFIQIYADGKTLQAKVIKN